MNFLEITEDKIFQVLGKGRDPKFERIGWLSKKADKALEVKADERFR